MKKVATGGRVARAARVALAALLGAVLLPVAVSVPGAVAAPAKPRAATAHLTYIGSPDPIKAHYGRGNYVVGSVELSGSALPGSSVLSVAQLERLATDPSLDVGYENTYSFLTNGSVFSKQRMTGVKLYDLLVRYGLSRTAPSSTPVRITALDGYVTSLTLGEIEEPGLYNCYEAKGSAKVQEADVPVLLSYASGGVPLVGPTGDDPLSKLFTDEEGYVAAADNVGGPVRLTVGQTDYDDFNARRNAKWVRKVTVGDPVDSGHTGAYAGLASSQLTVAVFERGGSAEPLKTVVRTVAELEALPAASMTKNYYGGADGFFQGVDLWRFLVERVKLPSHEGEITFVAADGTRRTVDLAYVRNLSGTYAAYTTPCSVTLFNGTPASVLVTGVRPAIGFAKNGYPLVAKPGDAGYLATGVAGGVVDNRGGPLALLLPADGERLTTPVLLSGLTRIELRLDLPTDVHAGEDFADLAARRISFDGDALKSPGSLTVAELEGRVELMVTHAYNAATGSTGVYHGVDLLRLLRSAGLGLTVDADRVSVVGAGGASKVFTVRELEEARTPVLLSFSRYGKPLVRDAMSPGYDAAADNVGGPISLTSAGGTIPEVVSVSVSKREGMWTHRDHPYAAYGSRALTISGSQAKGLTVLSLAEVEAMPFVRDSFAASTASGSFQGIVLRQLLAGRLASGVTRPSKITVYGADGYKAQLSVADVFAGIESAYQPGERREIVLAYAANAYPLVSSPTSAGYVAAAYNDNGPLRLVVENTISSWVKDVRAIVVGDGTPVFILKKIPATAVVIVSPTASQSRAYVVRGSRLALRAVLSPRTSTDRLTWTSSRSSVATVSSTGRVTARAYGTAVIKVRASSGKSDTFKVIVVRRR